MNHSEDYEFCESFLRKVGEEYFLKRFYKALKAVK